MTYHEKNEGKGSEDAGRKEADGSFAEKFRVAWQKLPVTQQRRVVQVMALALVLMVLVRLVAGVRNTYRLATAASAESAPGDTLGTSHLVTQDSTTTSYEQ
jgi:hypothetical protein